MQQDAPVPGDRSGGVFLVFGVLFLRGWLVVVL